MAPRRDERPGPWTLNLEAGSDMNDGTGPTDSNRRVLRDAVVKYAKHQHIEAVFHTPCPRCRAEGVHTVAGYRKRNGAFVPRGWCDACGNWLTGDIGGIPAEYRTTTYLAVAKDNTAEAYLSECARCHSIGAVEVHHWAPVSMFADAWDWPMSELCVPCHRRWHQVTGVANGRKPT